MIENLNKQLLENPYNQSLIDEVRKLKIIALQKLADTNIPVKEAYTFYQRITELEELIMIARSISG